MAGGDLYAHDGVEEPMPADASDEYRSKLVHSLRVLDATGFSLTARPSNWSLEESETSRYMEVDGWNAYIGGWNDLVKDIGLKVNGQVVVKHAALQLGNGKQHVLRFV